MSANKEKSIYQKCIICGDLSYYTVFYGNIYACYEHSDMVEEKIHKILSEIIMEKLIV